MAPEIATTAPTERSMPPVAITSVMPSATSISGAPKREDVDQAAVEVAVLACSIVKKPCATKRLVSRSAAIDEQRPEQAMPGAHAAAPPGDRVHERVDA